MAHSPQVHAQRLVSALVREARQAGWARAKFEIKPDGSVLVDTAMTDQDQTDDFTNSKLRMGK